MKTKWSQIALLTVAIFTSAPLLAADPTPEELKAQIDKLQRGFDAQQKTIDRLLKMNQDQKAKIDSLSSQVSNATGAGKPVGSSAAAPSAGTVSSTSSSQAGVNISTQNSSSTTQARTLKDVSTAFDVPNSPAAAALGLSQNDVQHLKTPKGLIPALINGLDDKGHFQSGLSVDYAPYQFLNLNKPMSELRYENGESPGRAFDVWFQRVLVRTQISLATAKGTSDADKSSKIALGIHTVLANSDDPLNYAGTEQQTTNDDGQPLGVVDRLDHPGRRLNQYVKDLGTRKDQKDVPFYGDDFFSHAGNFFYNHVSLAVGAAPEWMAADESGHYEYAGTTAWGSLAFVPTSDVPVRLLLSGLYHQGGFISATDAVDAPKGATGEIRENSLALTGGIRFGTRDLNATATGAYLHLDDHEFGSDSAWRYAVEVDYRIRDTNSWITLTLSKDEGHANGKNPALVLGGFKIGLGGNDFAADDQRKKAQ